MPRPLHSGYPRARFAGPARPRRVLAGLAVRPREDQVPWTASLLAGRLARVLLPWFCRSGRAVLSVGSFGLRPPRFPRARFTLTAATTVGNAIRASWAFGPPDRPDAVTGMDFVILDGDKISRLYAFVERPRD